MTARDLDRAILIATLSHNGQVDKAGEPYILHPIRVMMRMTTHEEKIVAILHDVIEDTALSLPSLSHEGFGNEILDAIDTLTHRDGENYEEYIRRIKNGPDLARRVKLADLADNSNRSRIPFPSERDIRRWMKYEKAYQTLTED